MEEELANYFSNPSYRAANPELLEPVDSEEDWGDVSPVPLPPRTPQELPQQTAKSEKRQRYLQRKRERRRQTGGEGIITSITWTIINNSKLKEEL